MPKLTQSNPKYRRHRASGQARVTLDGRDYYLGPFGTKASKNEYDRIVGEWLAGGRRLPASAGGAADLTVSELIALFFGHAQRHYRRADGSPTSEVSVFRDALRPLRRLYGATSAAEFSPRALVALGEEMIRLGWTRKNINRQLGRVRQVFKWATARELVPVAVYAVLRTVPGLQANRTAARESEPVLPVADDRVSAVLPHLTPTVRAMVEIQLLSGMRPGEVCGLRTDELDTAGPVWVFRPKQHKNAHRGHAREVFLGPRAQELLKPYLTRPDRTTPHLFSPTAAVTESRASRRAARVTPLGLGNGPGANRRPGPKRTAGTRYTTAIYRQAIARACERAFAMPAELRPDPEDAPARAAERTSARAAWRAANVWHPNQLRHSAATRIRRDYGPEAAQVILGHKNMRTTELYAERNVSAAVAVVSQAG